MNKATLVFLVASIAALYLMLKVDSKIRGGRD